MGKQLKKSQSKKRRWGLAMRLEYRRTAGKNRKRPGKEK